MKHLRLMKGVLASLLFLLVMATGSGRVDINAETDIVSAPKQVNATYIWTSNSIDTGSMAASVYVLKAKTGNTIKAGTCSKATSEKASGASTYRISMTDLGIKKADKEVYLYVCDKDFEVEGQNISANLVIKASESKKVVGAINYAKEGMDWEFNVLSATVTDASKNEIKNPDIYWSYEADGTFFAVNDENDSATRKYRDNKTTAPNGFDGMTLKDILDAGGGTIYIKTAGKDGGTGVAQFGSQATQVKIPKRAKAPSVKIDAKKTSISIKNGFDFTFVSKVNGEYSEPSAWEWFTVLPYLKTADVKSYEKSIIPEYYYMPLSKKDPNAGKVITVADEEEYYYSSYTAFKFKTIDLTYLLNNYGWLDDEKFYIAVRKSATEKKPASEIFYIEVKEQALSPLVYTKENVRWEYLVDTSTDFDKKGLTINTVIPYPGSIVYDDDTKDRRHRHIATEGYAESFKVVTSVSGGTIKWADTDGDDVYL